MSDLIGTQIVGFLMYRHNYHFSLKLSFQRGNVVRYNWIHDTIRKVPGGENKGITLDSQHSSTTMMYNVLYNVSDFLY